METSRWRRCSGRWGRLATRGRCRWSCSTRSTGRRIRMRWRIPATRSRSGGLAPREARAPLELTGPSLRLRGLQLGDAPRILALLRDAEVSRYFLWEPPCDLAEAREYVQSFRDEVALR